MGSKKEKEYDCCWWYKEEEEVPITDKRLVVLVGFLLLPSRCGSTAERV